MLLVGSSNARIGFAAGMGVLRRGGSAVDAVEETIRLVELNPRDHSVGYGGLPNILGEVELDASLMDGRTRRAGAVCAVKGYVHAITLAKEVMQRLPHVLLAGAGAERFAQELGMQRRELLTPEALEIFQGRIEQGVSARYSQLRDLVYRATTDPEIAAGAKEYWGTVNVLALDREGNLASGVSTSGWAWKYPGRVGDSPILGAGNYCDNRYGAAACTGYGELALRTLTAHSIVLGLKQGLSIRRAARAALLDLRTLDLPNRPWLSLIALDPQGRHAGYTTETGRKVDYIYQTERMPAPAARPRVVVPIASPKARGDARPR